ncbi:unnamed protein product [Prunus armeniaca]
MSLYNKGTMFCERFMKVLVATIQEPDPWPSKPSDKAIIGRLSTLMSSNLYRSATSANALAQS